MHRRTTRPQQTTSAFGLARHSRTRPTGCAGAPAGCRRRRPRTRAGLRPASAKRHLRNALLTLTLILLTTTPTLAAGPQTTPVDLDAYAHSPPRLHDHRLRHHRHRHRLRRPTPPSLHALAATEAATNAAADTPTTNRTAILIAAGTYQTHNLTLRPNTDLYGGFDPTTWTRDIEAHPTVLDARSEGRVLIAATAADTAATANNTRVDGFEIRGGLIRGPGGGILIDGASPLLSNNVFTQNATLTPAKTGPPSTSTRPPTTAAPSTAATAAPPRSATT